MTMEIVKKCVKWGGSGGDPGKVDQQDDSKDGLSTSKEDFLLIEDRGVVTGGYIGIYTPKISRPKIIYVVILLL